MEKEHNQFLRDSQRHEDRSAIGAEGGATQSFAGTVDFESLVGGKNGVVQNDTGGGSAGKNSAWDDDVWGSIFNDTVSLIFYEIALVFIIRRARTMVHQHLHQQCQCLRCLRFLPRRNIHLYKH